MLNSITTPFEILEEVAARYIDEELSIDCALESIEKQFTRVSVWLERLYGLPEPEFDNVAEMHALGESANTLMLEGIEMLHGSVEGDDLEGMEEALETLEESHKLLLHSLEISEQIQLQAEKENSRELCSAML